MLLFFSGLSQEGKGEKKKKTKTRERCVVFFYKNKKSKAFFFSKEEKEKTKPSMRLNEPCFCPESKTEPITTTANQETTCSQAHRLGG